MDKIANRAKDRLIYRRHPKRNEWHLPSNEELETMTAIVTAKLASIERKLDELLKRTPKPRKTVAITGMVPGYHVKRKKPHK